MTFDDVKKLHQQKYREAYGNFLLEGPHLVLELQKAAVTNKQLKHCELYVTDEQEQWPSPFTKHVISAKQMAQITETHTPQGIVALVPMWLAPAASEHERSFYLHEIQDPGNLGNILRTLAWFGNFRVLLSPRSVDRYNSKVLRASMGAIFHVAVESNVTLSSLRERFGRIACLDMQGDSVQSTAFANFDCYVFGNEARGLPREHLRSIDARVFTIAAGKAASSSTIESLNLASAVNMCAYELNRR